jgi:hypothetical protein
MNFAQIQSKKMIAMQEQPGPQEQQPSPPVAMNSQLTDDSKPS